MKVPMYATSARSDESADASIAQLQAVRAYAAACGLAEPPSRRTSPFVDEYRRAHSEATKRGIRRARERRAREGERS